MKFGFTLAEVLVTLGIVGVVASMTLPTLNNNVQKRSYEAGAKKAYNTISNAVSMYMADQDTDDLAATPLYNNQDGLRAFVKKYFRVSIDCGNRYYKSNGASCYAKEFYSMDRKKSFNFSQGQCMQVVALVDGMSMCFDSGHMDDAAGDDDEDVNGDGKVDKDDVLKSYTKDNVEIPLMVEFDINGPNGPNTTGRDIFQVAVSRNGLVGAKQEGCDVTTEDNRKKCLEHYTNNAEPMPIALLQYYGWKMKY